MIHAGKIADGRVPLPARSGYTFRKIGVVQFWGKVAAAGHTPTFFGHGRVKVFKEKSEVVRSCSCLFHINRSGLNRASTNQLCPFHAVNKQVSCCVAFCPGYTLLCRLPFIHCTSSLIVGLTDRSHGWGGGYAARLFLLFSFPCSADHERDWPPCKVVFSGWQPIR